MAKSPFSVEKMYTFIKGYSNGAKLHETIKALSYAREKHSGQDRQSGEPYIIHPLVMTCNAISLGISDDKILATILLHDVVEDTGVDLSELPVDDTIKHSVELLTFKIMDGESKEIAKNRYYNMMIQSREATIAKLIDRCHNISSMAGTFSKEKLVAYIEETKKYIYPLLRKAKNQYPEYSDVFFCLKYHITSVISSIEETIQIYS